MIGKTVRLKALIFHMIIPCDKTFLLVPSSRSSVKVKYQGHNFKKMAAAGAFVFHKHILLKSMSQYCVYPGVITGKGEKAVFIRILL